ncbi:hypothetical protein K443DRAFT_610356 [Laccaria amethystina LaAM-08-1]|uniref:Uncharacterized protein n=1 Tax=Laccaria amethystina LaAM-08-1 TaxID=1095629 RepID=A0A0C9YJ54_9AGAR|nr:hypothetical protein K443DRAFT_610356 [Laccaria amethystina LaAM-08-1]
MLRGLSVENLYTYDRLLMKGLSFQTCFSSQTSSNPQIGMYSRVGWFLGGARAEGRFFQFVGRWKMINDTVYPMR